MQVGWLVWQLVGLVVGWFGGWLVGWRLVGWLLNEVCELVLRRLSMQFSLACCCDATGVMTFRPQLTYIFFWLAD